MEKYDFIIPFGSYCVTSYTLRANSLQTQSLPFDWIYYANLPICIELLRNGFKDFLSKDKLEYQARESKDFIFKNSYGIELIHDFKNKDLEIDYDEVSARYKRRIERLYQKIEKAQSILFVNIANIDNYSENQIADYAQELNSLYPHKKVKLLYFSYIKGLKKIEVKKQSALFDIINLPEQQGDLVKGKNVLKLYHKLFSKYQLSSETQKGNKKLLSKQSSILIRKFIIALRCSLIISKTKRHTIRHEFINKLYTDE